MTNSETLLFTANAMFLHLLVNTICVCGICRMPYYNDIKLKEKPHTHTLQNIYIPFTTFHTNDVTAVSPLL
jgi:hypothetical protein